MTRRAFGAAVALASLLLGYFYLARRPTTSTAPTLAAATPEAPATPMPTTPPPAQETEMNVPASAKIPLLIIGAGEETGTRVESQLQALTRMARLSGRRSRRSADADAVLFAAVVFQSTRRRPARVLIYTDRILS